MTFTCVSPEEVRAKYRAAEDKAYMVGVLADLTASSKKEVIAFLGADFVPSQRKAAVPLDREAAKKLYDKGHSDAEIADQLGVHYKTVERWRRENGLFRRNPEAVAVSWMELYEQGLSDVDIAQAVGVTQSTIWRWRHRDRLPPNTTRGGDHRKKREEGEDG